MNIPKKQYANQVSNAIKAEIDKRIKPYGYKTFLMNDGENIELILFFKPSMYIPFVKESGPKFLRNMLYKKVPPISTIEHKGNKYNLSLYEIIKSNFVSEKQKQEQYTKTITTNQ